MGQRMHIFVCFINLFVQFSLVLHFVLLYPTGFSLCLCVFFIFLKLLTMLVPGYLKDVSGDVILK